MKKETNSVKGITLIALIVTIIVILILASVGTYSGIEAVKTAQLNKFISEMKIMQIQVNNIYDKYKNGEEVLGYTGEEIINNIGLSPVQSQGKADKVFQENTSGITDRSGYRYFNTETINKLGIENVQEEFFINISKRSIISANGFEYNGNTYYTMEQIPNNLYNVDYKENTQPLDFNVKSDLIGENKYKITIEPIYSGNIQKWEVKYQLDGDAAYWNTSDELTFNVEKVGRYNIKIQNGDIESEIKKEYIGYVAEGMLLHYDGIINTRNGSNKSAEINTWEDLSGNRNDGDIKSEYIWNEKGMNLSNATSGIIGNYLNAFKITDFTIEIMLESYTTNSNGALLYDFHTSGANGYFAKIYNNSLMLAFGNTRYNYEYNFLESKYPILITIECSKKNKEFKIYINGENVYTYAGDIDISTSTSDLFGILNNDACNEGVYLDKVNNFRIYNRTLTDEEVKRNYEIDKTRFNIQ